MSDPQMLPTWLDAGAAALAGAVPPAQTLAGALPGLAQAQSLTPAQRLQRVQESGLAECGGAGEPIYLAWRQFLRGRGPSVLVIDATDFDARALGSAAVLESATWLLAEGVLIAAGLRDSRTGGTAPAGRADGARSRVPEHGRSDTTAQASVCAAHPTGGAAQQPAELLGRGTDQRQVTADPHAGDLVPDRPAVRRRCRPQCLAADAAGRHERARPGRAGPCRESAAARSRPGVAAARGRARTRCSSSTMVWAASCHFPSGSVVRAAVVRVRGDYPGAVHPDGDGR